MEKTVHHLERALDEEARVCARYLVFAGQAEKEGFPGVARLLRAAAEAKKVHARSHRRVLKTGAAAADDPISPENIRSNVEELTAAGLAGPTEEDLAMVRDEAAHRFKRMYPAMIADAVAENSIDARHSLEYAMSIDMEHFEYFKQAKADPAGVAAESYHICPLCGHTSPDNPPDKCPYCGVDGSKFLRIE